jgi:hypothetical protein
MDALNTAHPYLRRVYNLSFINHCCCVCERKWEDTKDIFDFHCTFAVLCTKNMISMPLAVHTACRSVFESKVKKMLENFSILRPIGSTLSTKDCEHANRLLTGLCCKTCKAVEYYKTKHGMCKNCRAVLYCSTDCQQDDWKEHKTKCKSMRSIREEGAICFICSVDASEPFTVSTDLCGSHVEILACSFKCMRKIYEKTRITQSCADPSRRRDPKRHP